MSIPYLRLRAVSFRNGFTLIEIVLVAVILVILLANLVPNFRRTADRLKAEQVAFELVQRLRLAHQVAIAQGESVNLEWHEDSRTVKVSLAADEQGVGFDPGAALDQVRVKDLYVPGDITLTLTLDENPDAMFLTFLSDGTIQSEKGLPATIELTRENQVSLIITVDAATSQAVLQKGEFSPVAE